MNSRSMIRATLLLVCLLPWLTACSTFGAGSGIPQESKAIGVNGENLALQAQIRQGHGGEPDVFLPLTRAQAAVAKAQAQPGVNQYAADVLTRAQAELGTAQQLWSTAISTEDDGSDDQLVQIKSHAHDARRLAQIARYTALGQINVAQLQEAQAEVQQARAAGGGAASLIGKRVVPGPFGSFAFQPNTARLTASSAAVVKKLAAFLQNNGAIGIGILAHTDNSEPPPGALDRLKQLNPQLQERNLSHQQLVAAYHMALSSARARAVAQALVQAGVAPGRVGARGAGSSKPVASNDTAKGRAANERVEAIIIPRPDQAG